MKYKVKVMNIGEIALDFLSEDMLIIYNDNAPSELARMSVIHEIGELEEKVTVWDKFILCENEYIVTAVGDEANYTLRTMGHCTLKFDGSNVPQLPGTIHLKGEKNPDIVIGKYIIIE